MNKNPVKAKIHEGKAAVGVFIASLVPSPAIVEILGYIGFDFVIFDAEHGPMDFITAENLVRAAEVAGIVPLVRVPSISNEAILPFLDAGMMGIQVPHVRTREDAEEVVRIAKFYPLGERGLTTRSRVARYGIGIKTQEYLEEANNETMIILQLEEKEAIENLSEILQVVGIDVYFLAPGDLSQSLGIPAQYNHPHLQEVVDQARTVILNAGKPVGAIAGDANGARKALEQGALYLAMRGAALITQSGNAILNSLIDLRSKEREDASGAQ